MRGKSGFSQAADGCGFDGVGGRVKSRFAVQTTLPSFRLI